MTDFLTNHRRTEFLLGQGTLTVGEVRAWAQEIAIGPPLPPLPATMREDEPVMISVLVPPDRRALAGATVL